MKGIRTYLAVGTASLLIALGCDAKKSEEEQAAIQAPSALELRIETTNRPSHDADDGFYLPGTGQYRIIAGTDTLDTHLPDLARRGLDPDLSYYTSLLNYKAKNLKGLTQEALSDVKSEIVNTFRKDLLHQPETQQFLDYLCSPENAPLKVRPGTKIDPIPPESLRTPADVKRYFGRQVPVEQLALDQSKMHLSLTHLTSYEGTLEEVIREANALQNNTYKSWRDDARKDKKPNLENDFEGFFFPLIQKEDGTYILPVYGISITGTYADGNNTDF